MLTVGVTFVFVGTVVANQRLLEFRPGRESAPGACRPLSGLVMDVINAC